MNPRAIVKVRKILLFFLFFFFFFFSPSVRLDLVVFVCAIAQQSPRWVAAAPAQ